AVEHWRRWIPRACKEIRPLQPYSAMLLKAIGSWPIRRPNSRFEGRLSNRRENSCELWRPIFQPENNHRARPRRLKLPFHFGRRKSYSPSKHSTTAPSNSTAFSACRSILERTHFLPLILRTLHRRRSAPEVPLRSLSRSVRS